MATVKWLKSPRHIYGIPRQQGTFSVISAKLLKKIKEEAPGMIEVVEDVKEDFKEKMKKVRTRPVEKNN